MPLTYEHILPKNVSRKQHWQLKYDRSGSSMKPKRTRVYSLSTALPSFKELGRIFFEGNTTEKVETMQ